MAIPAEPVTQANTTIEHLGADYFSDPYELLSMAWLLLAAGHETTVNLIGSGVLALLQHPDELARLRADPALLGGAVEELLRYVSPVNDATFRGGRGSAGLSGRGEPGPVPLRRPEELDVGRDSIGHLAFGHGIHYCVGAPLARWKPRSRSLIHGLERLPVRLG